MVRTMLLILLRMKSAGRSPLAHRPFEHTLSHNIHVHNHRPQTRSKKRKQSACSTDEVEAEMEGNRCCPLPTGRQLVYVLREEDLQDREDPTVLVVPSTQLASGNFWRACPSRQPLITKKALQLLTRGCMRASHVICTCCLFRRERGQTSNNFQTSDSVILTTSNQ